MAVRVSVVDSILGAAPLPRSPELRICENRALRGETGPLPQQLQKSPETRNIVGCRADSSAHVQRWALSNLQSAGLNVAYRCADK